MSGDAHDLLSLQESRGLGDHRDAWDRMVEAMPLPSPFLRSWWLDAVATDSTRYLLVLDRSGALRGGLPVTVRHLLGLRLVRFAGAGALCPDHLDVVCRPEDAEPVLAALDRWRCAGAPTLLDLDGLVEEARVGEHWGPVRPRDVAPYRTLSQPADYVDGLSTSHLRALRRAERKLARQGIGWERVPADGLAEALRDFRALTRGREGRQHLVAALPALEAAVHAGVERAEVRVDVLRGRGRTAAVMVSFLTAGRLSMYQAARSLEPELAGAGNVLLHRVFRAAAEDGAREIDMLRGDEDYKRRFVDRRRTLGRVRCASGFRARVLLTGWNAVAAGRSALGRTGQRLTGAGRRIRRLAEPYARMATTLTRSRPGASP